MKQVFVVGMGTSIEDMTAAQLEIIRSADFLVGGRRHLEQFADLTAEKETITGRLDETIALIETQARERRVVVLASGDPLLFGIGDRIVKALGADQVTVMPNVSSVAAAFARIREPWNDARIISLHGRDRRYEVLHALRSHRPVAVLTDPAQSPDWLARWLLGKGVDHVRMAVFEALGDSSEAFGWYDPERAANRTFAQPNLVILRNLRPRTESDTLQLGLPEDAYAHEAGLMTKPEVRAVVLAKLRLKAGMTLWDLGAGSGAVGIEASVLVGSGRIIAVEKDAGRAAQIRHNARRFGVYNHEVLEMTLPGGLETLPPPDRIFIGGGGRDLAAIVRAAVACLGHQGAVVANTVLVDSLVEVSKAMEAEGLTVEIVQMQVSRSKKMPWSRRMKAENPVWIVSGRRPPDAGKGGAER